MTNSNWISKTCGECVFRRPRSDPGQTMICNVNGHGKGEPVSADHPACYRFKQREPIPERFRIVKKQFRVARKP